MSTSDLHARTARFFLLAGQAFRLDWLLHLIFWDMAVSPVRDPTACLPSLAAAVRKKYNADVLRALSFHPLPGVLPPEAVPWHARLVKAWEVHRFSSHEWRQDPARRALVRLDGCGMPDGVERPSRLPELLTEARQIAWAGSEPARTGELQVVHDEWQMRRLKALAVLAAWRPARGVTTPPETLREWVAFWLEIRQSKDPILRGIAAKGLLNLPEADLRAASIPMVRTGELLRDLDAAILAAAERTGRKISDTCIFLLDWQPVEETVGPVEEAMEVARTWLMLTLNKDSRCRRMAWQQLIRWDRAGSLATCGIDLLPRLVRAAQTEKDEDVLWEMAQWSPATEVFTGTEKPDGPDLLRQLKTNWQHHRQSWDWRGRASAWLADIHLHRVGLATEPPDSFREAYLSAVAQENHGSVLLVLAQWAPGAGAPAALHRKWCQGWQSRLGEKNEWILQAAAFALLHQALANESGEVLRRAALEMWRAGTKEGQTAKQILNAALSRLHEVRVYLAAGSVPDFEEEPVPPAQRQYPRLALPPGHIADRELKMENGELKMENEN